MVTGGDTKVPLGISRVIGRGHHKIEGLTQGNNHVGSAGKLATTSAHVGGDSEIILQEQGMI